MDTKELINRPTKPGTYELSIHPDLRSGLPVRLVAVINQDGTINAYGGFGGCWYWQGDEAWLGRALWRPYVEPPDPFAEPVPKPVEQLPSDAELVKSAIRLMRTPRRRSCSGSQRPLWSRVMMLFGHGSTYSRAICRAHGFDPDEVWMIEESDPPGWNTLGGAK